MAEADEDIQAEVQVLMEDDQQPQIAVIFGQQDQMWLNILPAAVPAVAVLGLKASFGAFGGSAGLRQWRQRRWRRSADEMRHTARTHEMEEGEVHPKPLERDGGAYRDGGGRQGVYRRRPRRRSPRYRQHCTPFVCLAVQVGKHARGAFS